MVDVTVQRGPDGQVTALEMRGHAGYAEHGEDIVCAGASALLETAIIGLKQVARVPHRSRAEAGHGECRLVGGGSPEAQAQAQTILETIVLGLKDMQTSYPAHIRVRDGSAARRRLHP